jgi:hypothetical protein
MVSCVAPGARVALRPDPGNRQSARSESGYRPADRQGGGAAARYPIRLVVVDTLSRAMAGGNENAPDDMSAFIRNIDRIRQETGAHVLIVHHCGKDAAKGARGHSCLRAATDTKIELSHDTDTGMASAHTAMESCPRTRSGCYRSNKPYFKCNHVLIF